MLIPSPRHTPEDLALWAELEAADWLCYGPSVKRKQAHALETIQRYAAHGPCYVSVSWGKDSVVAAALTRMAGLDLPLVNLRCSNRNPDCDAVRDFFLGETQANYTEVEIDYGTLHADLAGEALDRATDKLWHAGIREAQSRFGNRCILGVRSAESRTRRLRCRLSPSVERATCVPLADWTDQDVFALLAVHHLPVHPTYAMLGGGRWDRGRLRTAEIGDTHGRGGGRHEWEQEYYGDVIRRLEAGRRSVGD